MFRITEDPSSGSLVQSLVKNYKNDSIVSVDMDKVGVTAAYSDLLCVCVVHCIIYLNINQIDALKFMSLFHACTCFEHTCSLSGGQNYTIQPLVSSNL